MLDHWPKVAKIILACERFFVLQVMKAPFLPPVFDCLPAWEIYSCVVTSGREGRGGAAWQEISRLFLVKWLSKDLRLKRLWGIISLFGILGTYQHNFDLQQLGVAPHVSTLFTQHCHTWLNLTGLPALLLHTARDQNGNGLETRLTLLVWHVTY